MREVWNPNEMCRIFFSYSGTLSSTDAQTLANLLATNWIAHVGLHMSNQVTLWQTVVTDLTSNTAAQAVSSTTGAFGAGTTADLSGLAAIIRFKIPRRYRGGHPRIYLPGVRTGDFSTQNTLSSTLITNLVSDWAAFISAINAGLPAAIGTLSQCNVSYFQGFTNHTFPSGRVHPVPSLRTGGPLIDFVSSVSVNPIVGSQRRRNLQP